MARMACDAPPPSNSVTSVWRGISYQELSASQHVILLTTPYLAQKVATMNNHSCAQWFRIIDANNNQISVASNFPKVSIKNVLFHHAWELKALQGKHTSIESSAIHFHLLKDAAGYKYSCFKLLGILLNHLLSIFLWNITCTS